MIVLNERKGYSLKRLQYDSNYMTSGKGKTVERVKRSVVARGS